MRPARLAFLLLVLAAARGTPAAAQAAGISIDDFAGVPRAYGYSASIPVRRGVASNVVIVKDLVDLVPFGLVSLSGGGSISHLSNGRTSAGKGFIQMDLSVPASQAIGSEITLNVGLTDKFHFLVVHRGEITGFAKQPDPATLQAGTPWTTTIDGLDLGGIQVNPTLLQCHTINVTSRSSTHVEATMTRAATCTATTHQFAVRGEGPGDPPGYARSNGQSIGFAFSYTPPPAAPFVGQLCASQPDIGRANIVAPRNGQALVFSAATPSPVSVTIRWDSLVNGVPAPNNEWVVTRRISRGTAFSVLAGDPLIVKGLQATLSFALPDTTEILVRARNCDQPAPNGSVAFSLLRQ